MNKKMKMKMCSMLLGLALFAACSSDDDVVTPQPKSYPLTIEVSENPLIPEGGAASAAATRAAVTTTSTLSQFNLNYVYVSNSTYYRGETSVAKDEKNGKWKSEGTWPISDTDVTWYASTGGTFHPMPNSDESGDMAPYLNFTIEEASSYQSDLLVSTRIGRYNTSTSTGDKLLFTFDHACSAIRLWVKKANNISDHTLSITKIKLCNVLKQGKYYYGTGSWDLTDYTNSRAEYTLFEGSQENLGNTNYVLLNRPTNGTDEDAYLFIIPQPLTAWVPSSIAATDANNTGSYLEITCTITKNNTSVFSGTAYYPIGITLAKGYQYDLQINLGKSGLLNADGTRIFSN